MVVNVTMEDLLGFALRLRSLMASLIVGSDWWFRLINFPHISFIIGEKFYPAGGRAFDNCYP